jgi:hypothetical protein
MISKVFIILAVGMVVTGTVNTLVTKYADDTSAKDIQGNYKKFHHPYVQTLFMFIGEFLCLLAYKANYFYKSHQGNDSLCP